MLKKEYEKSLKRFLKRKISYSFALLISFLITGEITLSAKVDVIKDAEMLLKNIKTERELILSKIRENEKRIDELDRETVALIKEGDYYAKTLDESKQFFFPLNWEHRHSRKSHKGGMPEKENPDIPDVPDIPEIEDYIDPEIPNVPPIENLPVIKIPEVNFDIVDVGDLKIEIANGDIADYKPTFIEIDKVTPIEIKPNEEITIGNIVLQTPEPDMTLSSITDINPGIIEGKIDVNYDPRYVRVPGGFKVKEVGVPADIPIPEVNAGANTGSQGHGGWNTYQTHSTNAHSHITFENFDSYTADGAIIGFNENGNTTGNKATNKGTITLGTSDNKGNNFGKELDANDLKTGNSDKARYFISDTLSKDTSVTGNYNFSTNGGGLLTLISLNPSGLGQDKGSTYLGYDPENGNLNTEGETGKNSGYSSELDYRIKTMKVGTVEGDTTININNSGAKAMVAIEHQEWDTVHGAKSDYTNGNNIGEEGKEFSKTYSVLWNKAKIQMDSGKQMFGIVVDVEHSGKDPTVFGNDFTYDSGYGSSENPDFLNIDKSYRKKYNNKTINDGEIIIGENVSESIGISYEGENKKIPLKKPGQLIHLRDDLYLGKITIDGEQNYGFRMKIVGDTGENLTAESVDERSQNKDSGYIYNAAKKSHDDVRVFGNTKITMEKEDGLDINASTAKLNGNTIASKITVGGSGNIGVSLGKSLSSEAAGYIKGESWESGAGKIESGYYLKDGQVGYEKGKVNPIANIHNLEIELNGENSIGFLRNRDYSYNNANDMIIKKEYIKDKDGNDINYGAIDNIDFGKDAKNSVLIRSDMYGITVDQDLNVGGELNKSSTENSISDESKATADKNVILQATISSWTGKDHKGNDKEFTSIGNITNNKTLTSGANNMIGMVASGTYTEDTYLLNGYAGKKADGTDIESKQEYADSLIKNIKNLDKLNSFIKNSGKIELTGINTVGMAVLQDNAGLLEGEGADKALVSVITKDENADFTDENTYNIGVHNEGTFTIKNADIKAAGDGSVALHNIKTSLDNAKETAGKVIIQDEVKLDAEDGAVGIFNTKGTIIAENGFALDAKNDSIGIYSDGGKINIGVKEDNTVANSDNTIINIENGQAGIIAKGGEINIANAEIHYSGSGYALHTLDNGNINFIANADKSKNSTLNLGKNAFGMEINGDDDKKIPINLAGLQINVTDDSAVVFNMTSSNEQSGKISTLLSQVTNKIENKIGIKLNEITANKGVDGYKIAMMENGTMAIDKNISQSDAEGTNGFFYFKRFVGQRIRTTVNEGVTVDSTMTTAHADKYFDGQIVGLEANSSQHAKTNGEATITLEKGSTVIANRLDGVTTGEKKDKGAIGLYSNFGTITLNEGSSVIVEKKAKDEVITKWNEINKKELGENIPKITEDTIFNEGIGIYAVNGSKVDVQSGAGIEVAGDKAVGIYGLAYREKDGKSIGNEFGENAKGQGNIEIINAGNITLTGNGSAGIYAKDNNTEDIKNNVTITNSGTITVGGVLNKESDKLEDMVSSVGIYGAGANISNASGTIVVGSKDAISGTERKVGGVGIYADNSTLTGDNLGTITLGKYSTGIMLTGGSKISEDVKGTLKLTSIAGNNRSDNIRIGVVYDGQNATTDENIANYNIDMSDVKGGKAIVVRNGIVEFNGNDDSANGGLNKEIKINGENSRGMRALADGTVINNGTITLGTGNETSIVNGSIGMIAMDTNGTLENKGTIQVNSQKGIGIYTVNNGTDKTGNKITNIGTINLNAKNSVGLYLEGAVETNSIGEGKIIFGENSNNAIGIYGKNTTIDLENKKITIEDSSKEDSANIYLYASAGTEVKNNVEVAVKDNTTKEDSSRTIGIYLDSTSKYTEGEKGSITAERGAVGLFGDLREKENNKSHLEIGKLTLKVDSQGVSTYGAVFKGSDTIKDSIAITNGNITLNNSKPDSYDNKTTNKALGIYAEKVKLNLGDINITHGTNNNDGSNGTGIYLKDGAYLAGGNITISGKGIAVGTDDNKETPMSVGVYYGTGSGDITNSANIIVNKGYTIGLHANRDLTNTGNLTLEGNVAGNRIGIYTSGDTITQKGNVSLGSDTIGIAAVDDNSDKKGNIIFNGKLIADRGSGKQSVGLYGETGDITNTGTITINGQKDIGIYSQGRVTNSGTITVGKNNISGTGIYLAGSSASFNGKDGTINVDTVTESEDKRLGIGIYLENGATLTDTGNLNLAKGNVGIYALNSDITKEEGKTINIDTSNSNEVIAVVGATEDGTTSLNDLNITLGKGSTGIYAQDSGVKILNVTITGVGEKDVNETTNSTGIYLEACKEHGSATHEHKPYEITDSIITINKGAGIVLGNNETTTEANATQLKLSGTKINVNSFIDSEVGDKTAETGIGIYIQSNGKLLANDTGKANIYNITNGIGIYGAKDSTININNNDKFVLKGHSVGVYTSGGDISIGSKDNPIKPTVEFKVGEDGKVKGSLAYALNGNITSNANIKVENADGFSGLLIKNGTGTEKVELTNTGDIIVSGRASTGIALIGEESGGDLITNSGVINIAGVEKGLSAGIYAENAGINNTAKITAGNYAAGIYYNGKGTGKAGDSISSGDITLEGTAGIGAVLKGNAREVTLGNITSNVANNLGLNLDNLNSTSEITLKNITLGKNSMGIYATGDTKATLVGESITVGDAEYSGEGESRVGGAIGVYAKDGVNLDLTSTQITAGKGGTAIYTTGGTVAIDNLSQLKVGAGAGALVYADGGTVKLGEAVNKPINIDGHFGIVLKNKGTITTNKDAERTENIKFKVTNGGIAIAIIGEDTGRMDLGFDSSKGDKMQIEVAGIENNPKPDDTNYSVGVYYKDVGEYGKDSIDRVAISQTGSKTVGAVFDNTYGTISNNLDLGTAESNDAKATNSIGILIRNNGNNLFTLDGSIAVAGENNIGIGVRESDIKTTKDITITGGHPGNYYPIGVYLTAEDTGYNYTGIGDMNVGDGGTGVIGVNYNINYSGAITVGTSAIGIYAEGTDPNNKANVTVSGDILAGNKEVGNGGIGVYGKNTDITVNSGNITLGINSDINNGNIGILSIGNGDIAYNAKTTTINGTSEVGEGIKSSIGIYKEGSGNIVVGAGNWNIGTNSFGVVVDNHEIANKDKVNVIVNSGNTMELGTGAIGIYTHGVTNVTNNGDIKVGNYSEVDGKINSSIGIYMVNEQAREKAIGENIGTITVNNPGTVGVQTVGNVKFTNKGNIVVNEGVGVFASQGSTIINDSKGTITLNGEGKKAVGMYASGLGSTIVNAGTINANKGIGMYIENDARLWNTGTINVTDGIGILGSGNVSNTGTIKISGTGQTIVDPDKENSENTEGAIVVTAPNVVEVNSNYYAGIGGMLEVAGDLKLNSPMVNIADANFGFDAIGDISGSIKLAPELAVSGNRYSFKLPDEIVENDINVESSPLFKVDIDEKSVEKVPYREILKDSKYNALYDGLDEALKNLDEEGKLLGELNKKLGTLYYSDPNLFYSTLDAAAEDAKGNIYSHVQSRMQDINRAFNNSFDEMEQSFNFSKDTDKFSVIYTDGDYKNSKLNIPDYDYNIAGLLYMKEYEGVDYNNKYGYTLGLAGSRFKFKDLGGSKENVLSLRAGVHNIKDFGSGLNLLTRGEIGYNRHMAERKLAILGGENEADFNSYHVKLENKFRKNLYEDLENEVGAYVSLDLEYGRFDDIKESGVMEVKVDDNDYFSSKIKAGLNGTGRIYLGNDWTMKTTGEIGYSYDLGENYSANKARLKDTNTGSYSLASELKSRDAAYAKAGIGFERLNYMGVTLEGEVAKDFRRDEDYWRVSLRFNYKFGDINPLSLRKFLNIKADNFFDFDKSVLKPKGAEVTKELADFVNERKLKGTLTIEGHTDWVGTEEYNQKLSERRAEAIKTELSKHITNPDINLEAKGYGELRPITTNLTAEGRATNRRVEIEFKEKNRKSK